MNQENQKEYMGKISGILLFFGLFLLVASCGERKGKDTNSEVPKDKNGVMGTWLLVYGETRMSDSIAVKDLSNTKFIKILNEDHFAFFNQIADTSEGFYGGGGTYMLSGNDYVERLDYIGVKELRGHEFHFQVEIKGDTLIQSGVEDVPEAGIKRHIVEKYIRIN